VQNLEKISLNIYSFGFYAGFMKKASLNQTILDIDGLCKLAKEFGFGGIEFPFDRYYKKSQIQTGLQKIKEIKNSNLRVFLDIENMNIDYLFNLIPLLPDIGISVLRVKMKQVGETIYGGNRYLVKKNFDKSIKIFKEQLLALKPILQKYSISLVIENHQDLHSSEIIEISNIVSEEIIGVNWDVGNSISVGETPDSFYAATKDRIRNVHLKDYFICKSDSGFKLVRSAFGEGYVDYKTILPQLLDNKNIINISIELGAQYPRICNINEESYWEAIKHTGANISKFKSFIGNNISAKNKCRKDSLSPDNMIKSEINDIKISINNIAEILGE